MATYLADKSALARIDTSSEVGSVLDPLLIEGEVATCGVIDLEVLYSAESPRAYADLATALRVLPRVHVTEEIVDRALEVQGRLAERSQHRGVPLPDLIVAACAESADLTVMHYDADYERIAEVTGQSVQWVVPRGSVD
ncbi:MAG TPA: PIN domain nuclease [Conexibacter sp.]|jgi:predicted nucleic acid-binding protein|nr:PIN domain nuclease [Conexibacter sp.]